MNMNPTTTDHDIQELSIPPEPIFSLFPAILARKKGRGYRR